MLSNRYAFPESIIRPRLSLGNVQALVLWPSEDKNALKKRIKGIFFLGTPHRGTNFTRFGQIAGAAAFPLDSNTAILCPLVYDSKPLLDLQSSFNQEYGSIQRVYFYEKHKMRRYLLGFIPWIQEYVCQPTSYIGKYRLIHF